MAKQEQQSSETQGVFLKTKDSLLPLGSLTVQNLGKDGELFWVQLLNNGVSFSNRISGESEEKALEKASAMIRDIGARVAGSPKDQRLVINL